MEQDELPTKLELEEGELSDQECDLLYTPLVRPAGYSQQPLPTSRFPVLPHDESESDLEPQSSSTTTTTDDDTSSDSDRHQQPSNLTQQRSATKPHKMQRKKPKIKLKPKTPSTTTTTIPPSITTTTTNAANIVKKQKKYDIWSTRTQEDVLAETLNSCDVTQKDRSRQVESYGYHGTNYYVPPQRVSNKRTRDDRRNRGLRLRNVARKTEEAAGGVVDDDDDRGGGVRGCARVLQELRVDFESNFEEIASDIANKLFEEKEDLILKVVNTLGKAKTIELYNETKRIEQDGGLLIMNQTRRRTPGGVLLYLVRHDGDITEADKQTIFSDEKEKTKTHERLKRKHKFNKIKLEIAASRAKLLPDLLTRAELLATNEANRERKVTANEAGDVDDVINPPPTPETDCHETSEGGEEGGGVAAAGGGGMQCTRKIEAYDDDFLDLGVDGGGQQDMEIF